MELEGCAFDDYQKLPTFAQWLKTASDESLRTPKIVTKVWKPNTFPNFTLETELFRLRIKSESVIGDALENCLETTAEEEGCLYVQVIDRKKGTFRVGTLDGEKSTWEAMGENGYKLTVQDKPTKKRAPKNS